MPARMKKGISLLLSAALAGLLPSPLWAAALAPRIQVTAGAPTMAAPTLRRPEAVSVGLPLAAVLSPASSLLTPAPSVSGLIETAQTALAQAPLQDLRAQSADAAYAAGGSFLGDVAPKASLAGPGDVPGGLSSGQAPLSAASSEPQAPQPAPAKKPFFIRHHRLARLLVLPLVRLLYRVDEAGLQNLPAGPALIVPNHVSYVDALIIAYAARRPMRFMLKRSIYETKGLQWLFAALGAIPVSPRDKPAEIERSLETARQALRDGQTVVIFPEGALTRNGQMQGFRRGFERISAGVDVPVVPAHLDGLWGSAFSLQEGPSLWSRIKQVPRRVIVRFGAPLEQAAAQDAREAVQSLGAASMAARIERDGLTLPRLFLRTAKKFWSRPAAADSTGQDLSYGRTLTAAVLLAGLLKAETAGSPNVAVLLPPTVGAVLANVGLSIAGRTPVNLNYTAGADALSHAKTVAGLEVVVTSKKFVAALKERGAVLPEGRYVYLEDLLMRVPAWKKAALFALLRVLPRAAVEALFFRAASSSLSDDATVLFTSGSSSLPKGVELTHLNIRANVEMVREVFPWAERDTMLGVLPFFHSFGYTIGLWFPLLLGMSAAYHTHPLETDAIAKLALRHQPTLLLGTPTFLQRYVQKIPKEAFAKLRLVIAGAEKLRGSIAAEFEGKFGVRPLEGYGATELSPVASVNIPDIGGQTGRKEGSVGQPMPGTVARIVDPATMKPLPLGQQGLLVIEGPHVMKGYLGDPKRTAEALQGGRYLTGDLATMDRDGFVTLGGRMSRFSKIAGEMVSHVAVEEKLQQAAAVSEQVFVVAAVPDEKRGERLIVLYSGWEGSVEALLSAAKAAGMPNLWTPAKTSFYKIDKIPVLGTGKLDLKAVNELVRRLAGA